MAIRDEYKECDDVIGCSEQRFRCLDRDELSDERPSIRRHGETLDTDEQRIGDKEQYVFAHAMFAQAHKWQVTRAHKPNIEKDIVSVASQDALKYVMEEGTSGRLKKTGLLKEYSIQGCNLGIITDSKKMMDYLMSETKNGRLTYLIPKKYYKKI